MCVLLFVSVCALTHGYVGVLHEHHQVDEELTPPPQDDVCLAAILLKLPAHEHLIQHAYERMCIRRSVN